MIIASKGAAGVTGAGLATLAGGLSSHRPELLDGLIDLPEPLKADPNAAAALNEILGGWGVPRKRALLAKERAGKR